MSGHAVVVFSNEIPAFPATEHETGTPGKQFLASVAVCRDCDWRGKIWNSAQAASDEARQHRLETESGGVLPCGCTDRVTHERLMENLERE